jgi:hypothetical protein
LRKLKKKGALYEGRRHVKWESKRPRSKKDNDLGEIALSRHNLPPRKICPGNPGQ